MAFWIEESEDSKGTHVVNQTVAVATENNSTHCIASRVLGDDGVERIELDIQGKNLLDDKIRIGFGVEGWQSRNDFKGILGSTEDSWALSSGSFYHNDRTYTGPGFPKFHANYARIRIILNHVEKTGEFWLDGENVNMIRDLPKNRYQILLFLQNASVTVRHNIQSKTWAPSVLDFINDNEAIEDEYVEKKIKKIHKKFVKEIRKSKKDGKRVNILLIGEPGFGKSSFINSIMTACDKNRHLLEDVLPRASVLDTPFILGGEQSCHTRKISAYKLPKSSVYLWDCFGMTAHGDKRYLKDFSSLMEGKLRPGYSKDTNGVDQPEYVVPSKRLEIDDRIHCVFVFICAEQLIAADDTVFDAPREFIQSAQKLYNDGLRVIVILTKVDVIGKNQFIDGIRKRKFNMQNVYKNPLIFDKVLLIKNQLGVGINQIIPVQNYSSSEETEQLSYFNELFHLRAVTLAMKYSRVVKTKFSGNSFGDSSDEETKGKNT